jgi:hypothetical protein
MAFPDSIFTAVSGPLYLRGRGGDQGDFSLNLTDLTVFLAFQLISIVWNPQLLNLISVGRNFPAMN